MAPLSVTRSSERHQIMLVAARTAPRPRRTTRLWDSVPSAVLTPAPRGLEDAFFFARALPPLEPADVAFFARRGPSAPPPFPVRFAILDLDPKSARQYVETRWERGANQFPVRLDVDR